MTMQSLAAPLPRPDNEHHRDRGCVEAFSREFDYIRRTLRRLGVPRANVDDQAHEVFLVLHRNWEEYDPARSLRAYLFGIAFRVASSSRRRTWRETSFAGVEAQDAGPVPDRALEAKQARALVRSALACIPWPRRVVLAMYDLDEIPMRDIARELSIPLFTGYSRLRKARLEFERAVVRIQSGSRMQGEACASTLRERRRRAGRRTGAALNRRFAGFMDGRAGRPPLPGT